jgi:hypothetical protein
LTRDEQARRRRSALLVAVGGLGLFYVMWKSGGDFWREQRPFMPVTLVFCALTVAVAVLAVLSPRGRMRMFLMSAAVFATLAIFFGEGQAERQRFETVRAGLQREALAVQAGSDCTTRCRIFSREPLRVAFLLSGDGRHWSGACHDATDQIRGAELAGRVRPLSGPEAALLGQANAMFGGEVRHAPAWGDHWFGCSTRP